MLYAIAGLQRTGTNYLERVIADNFGRGDLKQMFWKHSLCSEVDSIALSSAKVILNIRHPITWLQSCLSNTPLDIIDERPHYFLNRTQFIGYAELYSDFYREWMKYVEQSGGMSAKYEDVLSGNFSILAPLATSAGRTIGEIRADIHKVAHSVELSGDDLERHRRLECHLPKSVALEFWESLDHSLTDKFGYGVEDIIFTENVGIRTLAYRVVQHPWALSEAELDKLFSASSQQFADNCQVLHAMGRQMAQRRGDLRAALDLYKTALSAGERERELYGVHSDFLALGVIEDIRSILPKIAALDDGGDDDLSSEAYEKKYWELAAHILSVFENTVASVIEANSTIAARCKDLVELGGLLRRVDRLEEAQSVLGRAIALNPSSVTAHALLGDIFQCQGRLEEAETSLRKAIGINPEDGGLRAALSDVLRRQGKIEAAFAEAEAAIRSIAPAPSWFRLHGNLALSLGRLDLAAEGLQTALRSEPDDRDHLLVLADVQRRQGQLDEAGNSLRRAIRIAPHDGHLRFMLSDVLERQGRTTEAFEEAAAAIRSDAAEPWWFHRHACLALTVGRLDEASESLETALRSEPDQRDHLFVLADVQRRQGRLDEAANSLRRAIQSAPHDGHLHFRLSDVLGRQGRLNDAANEAAAAIECPGAEPWWFHHHARLASRVGDLGLAESSLRRALEFEPGNPRRLFALAKVLLRSNRPREAQIALWGAIRFEFRQRFSRA